MKKETRKHLIILLISAILTMVGIITKTIEYFLLAMTVITLLFLAFFVIITIILLVITQKVFKQLIEYEAYLEFLKHEKYKSYFDYTIKNENREELLKSFDEYIETYSNEYNILMDILLSNRVFLTTKQKNFLYSRREIHESSRV